MFYYSSVTSRREEHPIVPHWIPWPDLGDPAAFCQGVCRRRMYLNGVKGVWSCWTCFCIKRTPPSAPHFLAFVAIAQRNLPYRTFFFVGKSPSSSHSEMKSFYLVDFLFINGKNSPFPLVEFRSLVPLIENFLCAPDLTEKMVEGMPKISRAYVICETPTDRILLQLGTPYSWKPSLHVAIMLILWRTQAWTFVHTSFAA